MPLRRYPRLTATDTSGRRIVVPHNIAPKLLPHEKFTSTMSQEKLFEISKAQKRVTAFNRAFDELPVTIQIAGRNRRTATREAESSSRRVVLSSSTHANRACKRSPHTASTPITNIEKSVLCLPKTGSSASRAARSSVHHGRTANVLVIRSSQAPTEESRVDTSSPHQNQKRAARYWTAEEDGIVLSAVMAKLGGERTAKKLPQRSTRAVIQRYYMTKKKHEKALAKAEKSDFESSDSHRFNCGQAGSSSRGN